MAGGGSAASRLPAACDPAVWRNGCAALDAQVRGAG
jgi:hypothetical protein